MSVAGKYKVNAATPNGSVEILLELIEIGGAYIGTLSAQNNFTELKEIKVDENSFSANATIMFNNDRFGAIIKGTVDGYTITGNIQTQYLPVAFIGQKITQ